MVWFFARKAKNAAWSCNQDRSRLHSNNQVEWNARHMCRHRKSNAMAQSQLRLHLHLTYSSATFVGLINRKIHHYGNATTCIRLCFVISSQVSRRRKFVLSTSEGPSFDWNERGFWHGRWKHRNEKIYFLFAVPIQLAFHIPAAGEAVQMQCHLWCRKQLSFLLIARIL